MAKRSFGIAKPLIRDMAEAQSNVGGMYGGKRSRCSPKTMAKPFFGFAKPLSRDWRQAQYKHSVWRMQ